MQRRGYRRLGRVTAELAAPILLPWLVAGAALFGLLIGSFLNVVVWRVPRGESLLPDSHCPQCGAAIRPWQNVPVLSWIALRGRCARCRGRISARYPLVELGTALAFALVAWWAVSEFGWPAGEMNTAAWWLTLVAYLAFAGVSISLALIDLDHQRLPDVIVLPSLAVITALLALAATLDADWPRLISALGGAAALFVLYLVIALVYPRGIGGGDVKLAPLLGAAVGFIGWSALVVGAFAGFALGAVVGLALIAARRATRKTALPFGPFMLIGAWIGIGWGETIAGAYLGLFGLS